MTIVREQKKTSDIFCYVVEKILALKLISSIPKKNLHFVWKRHISWINKNPPGGIFASGAVLLTITFKVSAFHFFGQNLTDVPIWSTNLKLKLITIIVAGRWFL